MEINWLAVIVAALASFPVGFVWYAPFGFGKIWQKELAITGGPPGNMAPIFAGAFVAALIQSATFAMFLGPTPFPMSAFYGFIAGLCWVGMAFVVQYLFEQKSWRLMAINAGYNTIVFTLIGAIIGAWPA